LPPGLSGFLSPPLGELRAFSFQPLGLDHWRPVSHDPAATALALVGSLSAAAALVAAAGLSRSRRSRRLLAAGIGLTGVAVALIGFGHALADAHSLFGLHRFQNAELPFLTPFGNPNHLAAFATLATVLLLGLAVDAPERPRQALWLSLAVVAGAPAFLSLSRGGIAFWCAGQLAFGLLVLRGRGGLGGASSRAFPVFLGVAAAAFVAGYLAFDRITARLATLDTVEKFGASKVELWPMFARPASAAWLTGLGRGTFLLAFPRWQTAHSTLTFTFQYPENLPLQLATELGIPATLLLAGLAAWAVRRTWKPDLPPIVLAAFAGVGALVLHDLFDFALELPACATAAAVALGIASGPWMNAREATAPRSRTLGAVGALVALGLVALLAGRHDAESAEARLAALAGAGNVAAVRSEARSLVDAHPADHVLYRITGWTEATRPGGQPRLALAWLNRALFLRPLDPETHRVVARALYQLGAPDQALVEERLAMDTGANVGTVLAESLPRAGTPELLWALVGDAPANVEPVVTALWNANRRDDARAVLDQALLTFEGRPEATGLLLTSANLRMQTGDAEGALALLEEAERAGEDVAVLRAQALSALGRRREAIQTLESAIARHPADAELAFTLSGLLLADGKPALARAALDRVQPFLGTGGLRVHLILATAETYRVEGRYGRALELVQTAVRLAPGEPGLHHQAAQLYESMRRPEDALHELATAVQLSGAPADPATVEWMGRLRGAVEAEKLRAIDPSGGLDSLDSELDAGVGRRSGRGG
jgi:tetratricopeptide (TPR) repeat protein